jgi:stage II sporulation protein AA (anti-sigma F factor antagonist)
VQVTTHPFPGALVLRITGELDVRTAGDFRQRVDDLVTANPQARIILNLSRLTFLDSTGLGAILGRVRRLQAAGRPLALVPPVGVARSLLDMVALGRAVSVFPTERAAVGEGGAADGQG